MKNKEKPHHRPKQWVGCDLEEQYFGDDRKSSKQDRKLAQAKDRSKYKKTDQDKLKQKVQKGVAKENLQRGRVLSIVPEGILVDHDGQTLMCSLRGVLKKEKSQYKNLVTVGDFVLFEVISPTEGLIELVEPRHSFLSRADNISRRKEQLIAANIDQVLITVSVVEPALKPFLADRYIIATRKGGMEPIIVVNKIDLLEEEPSEECVEGEEGGDPVIVNECELLDEFIKAYSAVGVKVIPVSTVSGVGLEELKAVMKDKASVFSGQSGVGKSSLINAMTGLQLEVRDVVEKTKKGSHTTTTAKLLPLEFGGWCIDTPGIKSFGVWDLQKDEIEQYFSEIFAHGRACKYPDCSHHQEAGCAVIIAVEKEQISPLRYGSYLALIDSVSQEYLRR